MTVAAAHAATPAWFKDSTSPRHVDVYELYLFAWPADPWDSNAPDHSELPELLACAGIEPEEWEAIARYWRADAAAEARAEASWG